MSRKSERLVNLTIALLATKRYLTKNEIFRSVEGYEGTDDAKERMFERDKDDLRSLGIEIEVGGLDPLFNDEAGYRIKPEDFKLDLGEISGIDIALLSLAAQAWNGEALNEPAHSALVKLQSMGIDSDLDAIPTLAPRMASSHHELTAVLNAIASRTMIGFEYLSSDLVKQSRQVFAYAVASRDGHWYLSGLDTAKDALRTFRFDRISEEIHTVGKSGAYEIPTGFDLLSTLDVELNTCVAVGEIRKGRAHALRKLAHKFEDAGEWERIWINYGDATLFIDSILWHLDDAFVVEPQSMRESIVRTLQMLVKTHG